MQQAIKAPRFLRDEDLAQFFERWRWLDIPSGETVTLDFENSDFLAPWAWLLFTAWALWLRDTRGVNVQVRLRPDTRAGEYARKLGLGSLLAIPPGPDAPHDELRTSPLVQIRGGSDIQGFAAASLKILAIPDAEIEGALKYSIIELLRNVVQHARSPTGGLAAAQYFPRTEYVQIAVADRGLGLQATLEEKYPGVRDDTRAVKLAMLPHVSGTFAPAAYGAMKENAGLGLFFIRQIAVRSGGRFFLASGSALADVRGTEAGDEKRHYVHSTHGWSGTFAVVQLRGRSVVDFGRLLEVCRQLAAEARKDPSGTALDFVDEGVAIPGIEVVNIAEFVEDVDAAARIRDDLVIPVLSGGGLVLLDFGGIPFVTQSFVHALLYRVFRDAPDAQHGLTFAGCTGATREAIFAVSAYAKADKNSRRKTRKPR